MGWTTLQVIALENFLAKKVLRIICEIILDHFLQVLLD